MSELAIPIGAIQLATDCRYSKSERHRPFRLDKAYAKGI
jgi:hypothetical protein